MGVKKIIIREFGSYRIFGPEGRRQFSPLKSAKETEMVMVNYRLTLQRAKEDIQISINERLKKGMDRKDAIDLHNDNSSNKEILAWEIDKDLNAEGKGFV